MRDGTTDALARAGLVSQNDPVRIVPAHDAVDVVTWRALTGNGETIVRLDAERDRRRTQACYCSMLGECWISELTPVSEPRAVTDCHKPWTHTARNAHVAWSGQNPAFNV